MVEHQVYGDAFNKNEKTEKCIDEVVADEKTKLKIGYVYKLFKEYINRYKSVEEFYDAFLFNNSGISMCSIKSLVNSNEMKDKLRLLIYSCYRIRCNLFHALNV